ncbi:NYN domain-containing protein [Glycomyces salinus]|uniref:NYN domain-containing protein n=1 Tax=Glycomyces salinus TaxID=980294 RepID=UPI0018EADE46|nr:NYN domain-containing protein [Glycomyces salinus]
MSVVKEFGRNMARGGRGERVSAVYLDFENLVLGTGGGAHRERTLEAERLQMVCYGFGTAVLRRAYAEWANAVFGDYRRSLADAGVDLVEVDHVNNRGKNAADLRIAVDAMECMIIHPEIEVFYLVTGDNDFSPLVGKLREYGKHVVGIGPEQSAGNRLVSVCSSYLYWEHVGRREPEAAPTRPVRRASPVEVSPERSGELLEAAFKRIGTAGPVPAATLKHAIKAVDPDFDEQAHGYRRFREFLEANGQKVQVVGRSGMDLTVALVEAEPVLGDDAVSP